MELGEKICHLRKLSGMTQEQLAGKLNIARQTLSKWENGTSVPDVESVVRLSSLFRISLDELLLGEEGHREEEKTQITLEDMLRVNAHSRRTNLLFGSGLVFLMVGILITAFEKMLEETTGNLTYILYRYIAVGEFQTPPLNYERLLLPALLSCAVGAPLCLCGVFLRKNRD